MGLIVVLKTSWDMLTEPPKCSASNRRPAWPRDAGRELGPHTTLAFARLKCDGPTVRTFGVDTFPYRADALGSAAQFNRGASAIPSINPCGPNARNTGHGGYTASGWTPLLCATQLFS